jgi:hypothetical protein
MTSQYLASFNEHLTPKLKQYVADRIVHRFHEHKSAREGVVLLDANLFQDLMISAFNDAARDSLIEDSMKLPLVVLLVHDEDFFTEVRWSVPLLSKAG